MTRRQKRAAVSFRMLFRAAMVLLIAAMFAAAALPISAAAPIADEPFPQEYREPFVVSENAAENDVRAVAVDQRGQLWAASAAGVRYLRDGRWQTPEGEPLDGPAYHVLADEAGNVWVAGFDGVYRTNGRALLKTAGPARPIARLAIADSRLVAAGPDGYFQHGGGGWQPLDGGWSTAVRDLAEYDGALWAATRIGLYRRDADAKTRRITQPEDLLNADVRALAVGPDGRLWIGSEGGLDVYEGDRRVASYVGKDGLPSCDVRSLDFDDDGLLWIGTSVGMARFDGSSWSLRHNLRWLPSDEVRGVAFGPDGTTYVATGGGVAILKRRPMTLAEKADHFQAIMEARHERPPGLVRKCRLRTPGDLSTYEPMDTDNDGLFTGTYLGAQCYRYAATGDPAAKRNAQAAFRAMEFLQTVTETPGFVARTVVPSDWTRMADANRTYTPIEIAEMRVDEPRFKLVEERWRKSRDGKWLWKGDTSSDEITGHYYAYAVYYDLVADDEEKARVRDLVRRITDYIIDGGYVLRDIDGEATRWAVWSPEKLNGDPNWESEQGVNAVEILSYLAVAHHMTGDTKYVEEARKLFERHGYGKHIVEPQPSDPGGFTFIDGNLLSLCYPALMSYEVFSPRPSQYATSMQRWFEINRFVRSPQYNFIYASLADGEVDFDVDECVEFLRDAPWDLVGWTMDQSRREDVRQVRLPYGYALQVDRLLPPSQRAIIQWDGNPFHLRNGHGGMVECSAAYWLLPYWLARYQGIIAGPES